MTVPPPLYAPPGSRISRRERMRLTTADRALMQQVLSGHHGEMRKGALFAQHGEIDFRLRFLYQGNRPSFVLSTVCSNAGRFRITRRTAFDRRLAGICPHLPFTSGDQAFDDAFVVQTRDLAMTSRVLGQHAVRETIHAFFDTGVTALHVDAERVKLVGPRAALDEHPDREAILRRVEQLDTIGRAVTKAAESGMGPAPKYDLPLVLAWTITLGAFVAGSVGTIVGLEAFRPVDATRILLPTTWILLPALVTTPVLMALLLSRRTAPQRVLAQLALLLMLLGLPFSSIATVTLGNALFDDGPSTRHIAPVIEVARTTGKSKGYRAVTAKWWDEGTFRTSISRQVYDLLTEQGGSIEFDTRPGHFGIEWIEETQVMLGDDAR